MHPPIRRESRGGKVWLVVAVVVNLLPLLYFKYADFLVANFNALFHARLPAPHVPLPIGISFYTFQAISYVVDLYRGEIHAQANPLYYGMYHTLFPQLVAGPIVRYKTIETEVDARQESLGDFAAGLRRFAVGLGKKVLIANNLAVAAEHLLAMEPQRIGALPAWFGILAYTFQIYFDFSGYSDMAIGMGRMFGFHFMENFNYPYISRSVTEFWRRWHMSLSTFFRDYVYIPLGGNRVSPARWVLNLIFVWGLTGLWHGANWNFMFWGLYYGVLLVCEKLVWGSLLERLPRLLQHLYTILAFILGWVIFRIEDSSRLLPWFTTLLGMHGAGDLSFLNLMNLLHYWPWLVVAAVGSTPLAAGLLVRCERSPRLAYALDGWLAVVAGWSVLSLLMGTFNPFIYFRF